MDENLGHKTYNTPDVKNKERKKRSLFSRIMAVLFILIAFVGICGFTVINYMLHLNDYEDKFLNQPSQKALLSAIKPLIINGELTLSSEDLNSLIAYELQNNANDWISNNGVVINSASIDFEDSGKARLYVKYTDRNTKILYSELDFSFNKENQMFVFTVKKVMIGRVTIPDFLVDDFISKINTGKQLKCSDTTFVMPLKLAQKSDEQFKLTIDEVLIRNGELYIRCNKLFDEQMKLFNEILGGKAEAVLGTVIDTIINAAGDELPDDLLSDCIDGIAKRFVDQ